MALGSVAIDLGDGIQPRKTAARNNPNRPFKPKSRQGGCSSWRLRHSLFLGLAVLALATVPSQKPGLAPKRNAVKHFWHVKQRDFGFLQRSR
jgi:hypothetical protein